MKDLVKFLKFSSINIKDKKIIYNIISTILATLNLIGVILLIRENKKLKHKLNLIKSEY